LLFFFAILAILACSISIENFSYLGIICVVVIYTVAILAMFHAFRKANDYSKRGEGENADISLKEKEKRYWLSLLTNKVTQKEIFEPILEKRIETLKKQLIVRNCMNWFEQNKDKKYHY